MKTTKFNYPILIASMLTAVLFLAACSKGSTGVNGNKEDVASINEYFNSIPEWEIDDYQTGEEVLKDTLIVKGPRSTDSGLDYETEVDYQCPVYDRVMGTVINNFTSVGTNEGKVWPGAIIQGNSLKTGDIQLIQTNGKRADITLTTNIPLEEGSKTITPNSVTAQQAISDFMIAAGMMPEGTKAGGGVTIFRAEEATTFNQSMSQLGISAGFTDPQSQVGLDASLNVSLDRSSHTQTVVAQYLQEKFKVRVADDLISSPSDFFTDDFTIEDLELLEQNGEMGPDNIPLYIEEVTYGRIMLYSSTSDRVATASELSAAVEASMADYANAGGGVGAKEEEILQNTTHRIYTAGGTGNVTNEETGKLDWSSIFQETDATAAVPISFVARTINGKKVVGLINQDTHNYRGNCEIIDIAAPPKEVASYDVIVEWTKTDYTGLCSAVTCESEMGVGSNIFNRFLTVLNGWKTEFTIIPGTHQLLFEVASSMGINSQKLSRFNVENINEGALIRIHTMSQWSGSVTHTYKITRTTNFKE